MMNPYDVQRVYERGLVELAREQGRGRELAAARRRKGALAARPRLPDPEAPRSAVAEASDSVRAGRAARPLAWPAPAAAPRRAAWPLSRVS